MLGSAAAWQAAVTLQWRGEGGGGDGGGEGGGGEGGGGGGDGGGGGGDGGGDGRSSPFSQTTLCFSRQLRVYHLPSVAERIAQSVVQPYFGGSLSPQLAYVASSVEASDPSSYHCHTPSTRRSDAPIHTS